MEALALWRRGRLWLGIGLGLGSDFQIVLDGDRSTIRGRIPRARAGQIREFLRRDLAGAPPFAVAGNFGPGRTLRLRWAGRVDPPTRQRVRNVLVEILR